MSNFVSTQISTRQRLILFKQLL